MIRNFQNKSIEFIYRNPSVKPIIILRLCYNKNRLYNRVYTVQVYLNMPSYKRTRKLDFESNRVAFDKSIILVYKNLYHGPWSMLLNPDSMVKVRIDLYYSFIKTFAISPKIKFFLIHMNSQYFRVHLELGRYFYFHTDSLLEIIICTKQIIQRLFSSFISIQTCNEKLK